MCGILGIVKTDDQPFADTEQRVLRRLLGTLSQRGPDGRGIFTREHVGFGHHRLAIRDLRQGQQPWVSQDGNCVLVYNGELYNDEVLRKELSATFDFQTQCDTEVVMAAYLRWGRACVQRFRGMFAFGLYDFRKRALWLVRDRFGIKPLFFTRIGNEFVFASRIATILEHPAFTKHPDWDVLSHYLNTTRITLGRRTLYRGIYQLQPAEALAMTGERLEIFRYWDYPKQQHAVSYDDAVDQFEHALTEAVQVRMTSDVPVGFFLSGGVDSSTLAALVQRLDPVPRYATCAASEVGSASPSPESADLVHATRFAERIGANFQPVHVGSQQYLQRWHQLVNDFRLPLSTPSDVLIHEIAQAAKLNVGVVLGGEGADELLCGYEAAHWAGHDYDASLMHRNDAAMLSSLRRQYGRTTFKNEADHYFALNSLVPQAAKSRIISAHVSALMDDDQAMFAHYQGIYDKHRDLPTVEQNAIVLHQINLEALLSRLDATTMHAGLEARVPFTDHCLVETVFQLPFRHRIDAVPGCESRNRASGELAAEGRLRSKRLLRSVASRLLPPNLANRRKASFPTGVQRWLQSEWIGWASSYLSQSPFAEFLLAEHFRGELIHSPQSAGMWLWPIANLCLWGDAEFYCRPADLRLMRPAHRPRTRQLNESV